jgi:ribonuclease HI
MKKYKAYTDGSYQSSIQCGGYASIIYDENNNLVTRLYQGFKNTTNNRMEARAVLETLKYFKEPTDITIVSDSMYVVNTINQGWVNK